MIVAAGRRTNDRFDCTDAAPHGSPEMLSSPIQSSPSQFYGNAISSAPSARPGHTTVEMEGCVFAQSIEAKLCQNVPDELITGIISADSVINMLGVTSDLLRSVEREVSIDIDPDSDSDDVTVGHVLVGNLSAALASATPGSVMELAIKSLMDLPTTENIKFLPSGSFQYLQHLADVGIGMMGKLMRNEFEGEFGRCVSNVTLSAFRTGLFSLLATILRQGTGYCVQKFLDTSGATLLSRNVISAGALAMGPLMTVIGAIRDELNETANPQTRMARAATLTLSIGALGLTAGVSTAMPAFAAFGLQTILYNLVTELGNAFLPITDNSKANLRGTISTGVLNGMMQFLSFNAMNYLAPDSGPGFAMSQANKQEKTNYEPFSSTLTEWISQHIDMASEANDAGNLALKLQHDVLRGVFNAGADVVSQVVGGELTYYLQAEKTDNGFRINPPSAQIPDIEKALNQTFSTFATKLSNSESLIAMVIALSRFFSELGFSKENVDFIVNACVAALVWVSRPGAVYVNERTRTV